MTDVVIAGIGQTEVGEHWELSLRELAFKAIEAAQSDASELHPQALYIGNTLAPSLSRQTHLATLVADFAGLTGIEAATIEAGGASGGAALRAGYIAVKSGYVDTALVVGVEKVTDQVGSGVEAALSLGLDADHEAIHGMTPTTQAALLMRRYTHEFTPPPEAFAGFALTAHANGVGNPYAMFRKAIKLEAYRSAGIVSDPLNMFDIAPNADGAAAVLLARDDMLPPSLSARVRIAGSAVATDSLALHDRTDPLAFQAARLSVERACKQAQISPLQVDLFEIFDAYSIYAALSLEAAGFAGRGEGWKLAHAGQISVNGALPTMTMGGLKARGHPCGATGVYQVVEAVLQLRGLAGTNQVHNARRAMVQCLAGPASTAVTHVLEKI